MISHSPALYLLNTQSSVSNPLPVSPFYPPYLANMPRAKSSPADKGELSSALADFWTPPTEPRRTAASQSLSTTPTRKARGRTTDISTSQDLSLASEGSEYIPAEYIPRKTNRDLTNCTPPVSASPRNNPRGSRDSSAIQSCREIRPLSLTRKQIHVTSGELQAKPRSPSGSTFPQGARLHPQTQIWGL